MVAPEVRALPCPKCGSPDAVRTVKYFVSHSAFNGYREMPSTRSSMQCLACPHGWYTYSERALVTCDFDTHRYRNQ